MVEQADETTVFGDMMPHSLSAALPIAAREESPLPMPLDEDKRDAREHVETADGDIGFLGEPGSTGVESRCAC